jgi:hypothetical protein
MISSLYGRNHRLTIIERRNIMEGGKEFYSIDEIEKIVARNRGTIYNRIKLLGIQTHKFPMDRRTYVAAHDVEKIKTVIEKPWMAKELGTDAA